MTHQVCSILLCLLTTSMNESTNDRTMRQGPPIVDNDTHTSIKHHTNSNSKNSDDQVLFDSNSKPRISPEAMIKIKLIIEKAKMRREFERRLESEMIRRNMYPQYQPQFIPQSYYQMQPTPRYNQQSMMVPNSNLSPMFSMNQGYRGQFSACIGSS